MFTAGNIMAKGIDKQTAEKNSWLFWCDGEDMSL
jgi:hypothetical protein